MSVDTLKSVISNRGSLARTNNFVVQLPTFEGASSTDMNVLCTKATMPGKQVLTLDRRIGGEFKKVAYGYAVGDTSLSFLLTNDYAAKKYFDNWKESTITESNATTKYHEQYTRDISIYQLQHSRSIRSVGQTTHRMNAVYGVNLIEAFPTTLSEIAFDNAADGTIEVTVQLSYTNFKIIPETELTGKTFTL